MVEFAYAKKEATVKARLFATILFRVVHGLLIFPTLVTLCGRKGRFLFFAIFPLR